MVLIPAGEFLMGSPDNDSMAYGDEQPQHRVRITQPFYLSVYPVTQSEYQRVMGENPSAFNGFRGIFGFFANPGGPSWPVEQVSWEDAMAFCRRLSAQEGTEYRLPTEAEWEYACRSGSTDRWCFGDDESQLEQYAWYGTNSGSRTHPVGEKKPNGWGLYDMHGNVWEWCADWWDANYCQQFANKVAVDPTGPAGGSGRVYRGGCWDFDASFCRSACRAGSAPGYRCDSLGFRLARTVS